MNQLLGGERSLKQRVNIQRCDLKWAQELVIEHHYLHRPIHPLSIPFAYSISLDDVVIGTIIMTTPHFTKKKGLFGYEGLPTKWQVLQISRIWIDPKYQQKQSNGHASNIASCAIAKVLRRVNDDWLEHHPPKYPDQPYKIELIISYADTCVDHQGTIYQAANFQRWGETTNNRSRHGKSKGSKEPKILYLYRLDRKPKSSSLKVLLGGGEKLLEHKRGERSSVSQEISIPCLVKQPKQPEVKGVIRRDEGDRFLVEVDGEKVSISKLFVYPDLDNCSSKTAAAEQSKKVSDTSDKCSSNISPPSKDCSSKIRRQKGEGSGHIYYRTVTRNGKSYRQAYYQWRENGKQRTKYISKKLLSRVEEAESKKLPVSEILVLLGGMDKCSSKSSCTSIASIQEKVTDDDNECSSKVTPPSNKKRKQGEGTGYIECKPIKRSGKEYKQYWYHYEEWREGDRLLKKSKYIPKRLVARVEKMEYDKFLVTEILKVLNKST